MREMLYLGSVAALYLPVLLSPGPNFLVLSKVAVTDSRRRGIVTAIGITSASALYATLAVTGIGMLVAQSPRAQMILQLVGGAYLLYKGLKMMVRAAPLQIPSVADSKQQSLSHAYCNGLLTNLANPQALVFFTSVFATLLTSDLQPWAKPASVALVAATSMSVNLVTVTLFSFSGIQQRYLRAKTWIDRSSGLLLSGFGVRLLCLAWR